MIQQGKFILFDIDEFITWIKTVQVMRPIKVIQNHHTWQPDYVAWAKLSDHFHWLKSMEDYQVSANGFSQIAQNLTTFPDGKVALGRPLDIIPAGIKGANQYGICIEHLGNFDTNGDQMTADHQTTIIKLNAILCKKFADKGVEIVYHHWYDLITGERTNGRGNTTYKDGTLHPTTVKTCPGTNFFGGNTVESCQQNFIPLIIEALELL